MWWRYASDTPALNARITPAERTYIESQLPPPPANPLPLSVVFTNGPLLTVAFAYMCYAYVGWMFLFWIPTYLVEARGYALGVMGIIGIPLHASAFIGLVGGGMFGDYLLRRGWSSQFVRARIGGIGLALAFPFLLAGALVPSATLCVICLILFYGLFTSALACFSTVAIEFNQHLAGAIFGLINTLGTFAGFLGPLTAGYMLTGSDGNWLVPIFVATGVGIVSATVLLTVPIRPIQIKDVPSTAAVPVQGMVH